MILQSQKGVIVFCVSAVLAVLSLLGLLALRNQGYVAIQLQEFSYHIQAKQAMHSLLQHIAATLPQRCVISFMPATFFRDEPPREWDKPSCAGNFNGFQYYYVIESLGEDPCALVGEKVALYYRVSLFLHGVQETLQSTVITPTVRTQPCLLSPHMVNAGRQVEHFISRRWS